MDTKEITNVFNKTEERFKSVAPSAISYEAERGFAMQILTNNSWLMTVAQNNTTSLAQAIINVAAIGLSLNPAEKQAYLISRNIKEGQKWVNKIFLEPSYIGLCRLATNSGSIEWIQAKIVYEKDSFMDNGVGEKPEHKYNAFGKDRGDFVGVYCVAKTHTNDYLTTLLDAEQVTGIMARSEAYKAFKEKNKGNGGPWVTDFEEMAKKSVIRNAFKTWPRSVTSERMAEAVHLSNENEGFEPIITSPNITEFTAGQKEYFDQMIEKSDALGMYIFSMSFNLNDASGGGASIWTNLTHSFPKGEKGKYQKLVNELKANGESLFLDILNQLEDNIGDDYAVIELLEELDDETIKVLESKLNPEMSMELNRIKEGMKNG